MKGVAPALDRRPKFKKLRRKPTPGQIEQARMAAMIKRGTKPDARIWFQIRRGQTGNG